MIGIYKIKSPSNRIYIGQSIDIFKRFARYKSLDCKSQNKLYNSFLKYGFINHNFEILEECSLQLLNNRERYWQDYFNSADRNNLNCRYTSSSDKSGEMSKESKEKMSKSRTCLKRTNNLIQRLKEINTGSKRSEESRLKMSLAQTGKKRSEESRLKQSLSSRGRVVTEESKEKMRLNSFKNKKVICLKTGEIYPSLTICALKNNLVYKTIWLHIKNGTNLNFKYHE